MIFVARQLMEKTRKHGDSLFTIFIDLNKLRILCQEVLCVLFF